MTEPNQASREIGRAVGRPVDDRQRVPRPAAGEPVFAVPADVLARYRARVLDPSSAPRIAGQSAVRPTVYIADQLLVSGATDTATRDVLTKVVGDLGLRIADDRASAERRERLVGLVRKIGFDRADRLVPEVVRVEPREGAVVTADAWTVVQAFRTQLGRDSGAVRHVALDHLLTASGGPQIGGSPYVQGHGISGSPYVQGHGVGGSPYVQGHGFASSQYGLAGWGGRQPVQWLGRAPARNEQFPGRRPVVAVLDTGVADHPWLPPEIVRRDPVVLGVPIVSPELTGVTGNPYEGVLDPDAGHGTFIAGLVRQQCPDADILAVPVMDGDGVVVESNLMYVLALLLLRQQQALAANDPDGLIDVVSLSLGYYHELPDDAAFDPQLLAPLQELGRLGVAVVVAAGNDSTDRPMFPAAFTAWPGGPVASFDVNCLPIVSVGALNPDATIALFSNAGAWVTCHRPGASVVSTFPLVDAAEQASVAVFVPGDGQRSTVDPDRFSSGFAVWSGTSFAAPVLAGEIAAGLCGGGGAGSDAADAVARGWSAVTACLPAVHP